MTIKIGIVGVGKIARDQHIPTIDASPDFTLAAAAARYAHLAADPDGRLRATLEIVWLSGWAAHTSQQKPLRPGTARVSLRDVLGERTYSRLVGGALVLDFGDGPDRRRETP